MPAADTKGTCPEREEEKKNKKSKKIKNSPDDLKGKTYDQAQTDLDQKLRDDGNWTKSDLCDGDGVRYYDGKGNSVQLNQGYPEGLEGGGGDPLHQGPYAKISQDGAITRVPLSP